MATFEVGETVILETSGIGSGRSFEKVIDITPKGLIKVTDVFFEDMGRGRAKQRVSGWYPYYIYKCTPELVEEVNNEIRLNRVVRFSEWEKLDSEFIKMVSDKIKDYKKSKESVKSV